MVDNPYKYPYVPVGGIIEWDGTGLTGAPDLSTPEKVAAVYGYGTWERYGTDRVTVGAGGEYAAGSVGGASEFWLDRSNLPTFDAGLYLNGNTQYPLGCYETSGSGRGQYLVTSVGSRVNCEQDLLMHFENSPNPINNMQPYIANYRYRRIA